MNTDKIALVALLILVLAVVACDETPADDEAHVEPAAAAAPTQATEEESEEDEPTVASTETIAIAITGMRCVTCIANVQNAVGDAEGVISVDVDFGERRADVEYDPAVIDSPAIIEIIEEAGFGAEPTD